ncbi:DUF2510 domain-containing protein [Streptomyces ureilyticus]|uniref:DUF2510 domain-containing protein n=1 Tax=Streptomyces ureilyticus TaxID=1775131 RepID=A0ABX0DKT2_9ACTN|nr:DUF2510 domain-containing protein [Streptomyces ureilyticus]NGO41315.1 DUF2510 domain-containing protein [Streptomyces ureilyticus]
MTHVTPPGWYPDPGQTTDGGPATQQRWWDGEAWTEQTRPAAAAAGWGPPAYAASPGATYPDAYPGAYPGAYPDMPPRPPRRGLRIGIAIAAAVAVLAGIGGGVYALTGSGGSDGGDQSNARPAPTQPGPDGEDGGRRAPDDGESQAPEQPERPQTEEGYATDVLSGISIPVLDGWAGQSGKNGGASVSTGPYPCPGDTSQQCVRGGANSLPAVALEIKATTAEAAAKEDISKNAEESYGGPTYGKITSNTELASKAVTVAGEKGYAVRWKVVTSKGDDGYIESLAFPSPANPKMLVIVRFGFDDNEKAPKLSVIDEITKGIKEAAGGGGSGERV